MALPSCTECSRKAACERAPVVAHSMERAWHLLLGGVLLLALGSALLVAPPAGSSVVNAPQEGTWTTFANGDDVQALAVEGDVVWAGTRAGGAVRWDTTDDTYVQYLYPQDGLSCNDVRDIAIDSAGNKWFATCRGLSVLNDGGTADKGDDVWTTYSTASSGLPHDDVTAVAVDSTGKVWLGTNGGGVASFDGQEWTIYTRENTDPDGEEPWTGLQANQIFALIVDDTDRVWMAYGMEGYGVSVYDGSIWTHYTTQNSCLASDKVMAMAPGMGGVWLGTWGWGVTFIGSCGCVSYTTADGLGSNYVLAIAVGQDGRVWFGLGTSGGGGRGVSVLDGASTPCDKGDDTWTLYNEENSDLVDDR
ncbi:MAG: two-component regulator propeller domain-containing protein, partial [Anaerolineae bacterium]